MNKGKLTQQQVMQLSQRLSPLQVRFVRLLEMNAPEFEAAVERELADNPALEQEEPTAEEKQDDVPAYRLNIRNRSDESDAGYPQLVDTGETLYDSLVAQLEVRHISGALFDAAVYIVGNLDPNGYLRRSVASMVDDVAFSTGREIPESTMREALDEVRKLDPAGVGAHDLRDALMLQLDRRVDSQSVEDAKNVVGQCFDALAMRHYHKIISALKISDDRLEDALKVIKTLNPKPGAAVGVSGTDTSAAVSPDFVVEERDGRLVVSLAGRVPELTIDRAFTDAVKGMNADVGSVARYDMEFVTSRYNDARDFISVMKQRTATLLSVMGAIADLQKAYFLSGGNEKMLRPMVLKDVAALTGLDVSTVSRSTAGKYVQTDWGVIPLRHFFSEGVGNDVSAREVEAALKQLVDGENKLHPLSDDKLCEMLVAQGYEVSRRTVAKYRDRMGIPVARLRKTIR